MSQRKFESLTTAGKKMRIARDVIASLDSKKIKACRQAYVIVPVSVKEQVDSTLLSMKKALESKSCEACALGSMFVVRTMKKDDRYRFSQNFISDDLSLQEQTVKRELKKYFSERELALIEVAFEMDSIFATSSRYGEPDMAHEPEVGRAVAFGRRYGRNSTRMRAIMRNIIDNRGTFVP